MKIFRLAIATFTLILASAAYAVPVEVTFEGVVGDTDQAIPATPHFEAGFVVTTSREPEAIEGIFGKDSGVNTNGSAIFGWCSDCEGPQVISLARDDGGVFDFLGFDAAVLFGGPQVVGALEIVGHLDGGGMIATFVEITMDWDTFEIGWAGLTQIDIMSILNGGGEEDFFDPAIDNLVMNVGVPAPRTLLLLGLGLLVLVARRALVA